MHTQGLHVSHRHAPSHPTLISRQESDIFAAKLAPLSTRGPQNTQMYTAVTTECGSRRKAAKARGCLTSAMPLRGGGTPNAQTPELLHMTIMGIVCGTVLVLNELKLVRVSHRYRVGLVLYRFARYFTIVACPCNLS
jgi:hypothetical protein